MRGKGKELRREWSIMVELKFQPMREKGEELGREWPRV
jgi:hypothetical protein